MTRALETVEVYGRVQFGSNNSEHVCNPRIEARCGGCGEEPGKTGMRVVRPRICVTSHALT